MTLAGLLELAASYERVSTDEQATEGHSMEVQSEKNLNLVNLKNWTFAGHYRDPGVSGKNLNRPDMQRLLKDIDDKKVNIVVVHKLDRLTRNIGDLHQLITLFDNKGVKLVSVSENIDTSTAMGRMFVFMLGIFAQWYRENLAEEVIKGMTKRAEKGFHNITVDLYGYRRDEEGKLHIVEEQAKWVQYIFDRYCAGIGSPTIAKELNKKQIRRNQGAKWDQHKIIIALTNMHYTGHIHWKAAHLPENQRIIREGEHEAIISMDQYERVQRILQRRREGTISLNSYEYVFGGILKCGECGGGYKGKYNKRKLLDGSPALYRGYACSNNERYGTCKASGISEANVVKLIFSQFEFITKRISDYNEQVEGSEKDEREEIDQMLKQSELKRARWQHAYGEGLMNYDDFAARMREEMEKVKAWQTALSDLSPTHTSTLSEEDALQTLNSIKENWEVFDQDVRKQIIQHLFQKIVIKKTAGKWAIADCVLA